MKTRLPWKIGSALSGACLLMTLAVLPARAQDFPTLMQAQGPVDYWRFNETNKSPVINTVSNLGSVGSAGMGFVLNGALTGEPGIVGNSVRLLNAGQNIAYATNSVDIPNVPELNPEPPFTIEFWTKPNAPLDPVTQNAQGVFVPDDTGMCIVSSMSPNPNQSSRSGYLFYILSNSFTFRIGGENGYAATAVANLNISTTNWSHVVGEFDGTTASIYVNGTLMGSGFVNNSFHINQWTPIRVGGTELDGDGYIFLGQYIFEFSGNRGYDGWFDEFAIYNTILSSNTIANHYKAGTTAPSTYDSLVQSSSPVGYWNFDVPAFTGATNGFTPAADLGSLDQEGTNTYGTTADQPSVPGLSSDSKSVDFSGEVGSMVIDTNSLSPTFTGTGQEITLAAWIKPGTLGTEYFGDIIAQGYDGVLSENYLRMGDTYDWEGIGNPDTTYYDVGSAGAVFTGAGGYASAVFPVPPGDIGNWVFLVGTYDGTEWNLYRNGSLVATNGDGGIGPNQVDASWSVGSRSIPAPYFGFNFPGSISEAAIFTNALDAATILDLYNSVHRPPVITQAPVAPSPLYLGASVDFTIWADGPGTLSYQWYSNNVLLAGETQTNLALDTLTQSNSAAYAVVVSNPYGAVTSVVSLVVSPTQLPITLSPAAETRWIGSPITFAPSNIVNQPFTYQWFSNSTAIPGANSLTYTATATAASAGVYTLVYSNNFGVSTSSVATLKVLPVPPGYASVIVADNPLSYFRLDETSGSTAFDYAGGNDGTYNGGCKLGSPGALLQNPDAAVTFDGATNTFVGNIGPTAINFSGATPEFSIEAWANGAAGEADNAAVIAKGTGNAGEDFATEQFAIDVSGGVYRFYANDTHGDTEAATAKTGPDGNWHHLVGVCDGNSGTLTFYIDGAAAGTAPIPSAGILFSTDPVSIGAERSGIVGDYDWAYAGTIDEVAIYAYALTAQQVAAHYGAAYGTDTLPFVKDQPVSVTNYVNLPVSVSVNAAGTVPLTYQWNKLTGAETGPVSGATAATFSIANLALSDAGVYNCGITNSVGGIVSSNFTIVVLPAPTNPPSISGLVMHLTFDGNLTDATGRGNDATNEASGGAALVTNNYVPGVIGEAFTYSTEVSGTNVSANYASLGVRPDLEFGSGDFSVSMWIQMPPNYTGNDLPFFCDVIGSTFGHPGFSFQPSFGTAENGTPGWPGGWSYSVFDSSDTGTGYYGDEDQINDGSWHSLIFIIDHANGVSVYVDGVLAHQNVPPGGGGGSIVGVGNIDSANPATIGQDPTGQYPQDSGGNFSIDDLGVWNRAITPLEAAAIFTAGNISQLSFTAPVVSSITLSATNLHNGSLELTWSSGSLQSATNLSGPWITLTNVTSPLTTNTSGLRQFFRATQ